MGDAAFLADVADARRAAGLSDLRLFGGGGLFPHAQLQALCAADAALCRALRGAVRPDVRRNGVLSRTPERDLDAAPRPARHPPDGGGAGEGKALALCPDLCGGRCAGLCPRHARHGGLLRRGCADGVCLLLFPRAEVVVPARAARGAVLAQRGGARRADVSGHALRT